MKKLKRVGVAPIVEKMMENRLKSFEFVERRPIYYVVRRVEHIKYSQNPRCK